MQTFWGKVQRADDMKTGAEVTASMGAWDHVGQQRTCISL